jgi:hypothetical protein
MSLRSSGLRNDEPQFFYQFPELSERDGRKRSIDS